MLGNDVLTHTRRLLNDQVEGNYRWPKATLILYLNKALPILYAIRPSLTLQSDGTVDTDDTLTDGTETLLVADKYKDPLAKIVAAYALREDSMDAANMQMADKYEEQFIREVNL